MTTTTIIPFGLQIDGADTDTWSRAKIMANFTALNNNAIMVGVGLVASRPAAAAANNGLWWADSATGIMSRSNGVSWTDMNLTNPKPGYSEVLTTVTSASGTVSLDLSVSNAFKVTLAGNTTFAFSGINAAGRVFTFQVMLIQDGTGSRTVTWPATVKWPNAATPPISTGANKVDIATFVSYDNGTTYQGLISGNDFR